MVKILSYNIFFKSMLNKPLHKKCNIIRDSENNLEYNSCLKNVSNFIQDNSDCDFVLLQEATNWNIIQKITPVLQNMKFINHKYDLEEIVTFYGSSYKLDKSHHTIKGYMSDKNRPFLITFFNENLCIINLHAGHNEDIYCFDEHLINILENNRHKNIFLDKLKTYNIIIAGDFNDNLEDSSFKILVNKYFGIKRGRKLYGFNKTPSCCNYNLDTIYQNKSYDQILSTLSNISTQVITNKSASDHMPIIGYINKNIGYDFDGVLHINVSLPDVEGQRHPPNLTGPYEPFNRIIDDIINNLKSGDKIFIITARHNRKQNLKSIIDHLNNTKLLNYLNKITILFSGGSDKTKLLHKYKINSFYDDSCLRIKELYLSMKNGHIPDLTELYLVYPEKNNYVKITEENYDHSCINNQIAGNFKNIDWDCINKCYYMILSTMNNNL
ncbi:nuclease [Moumouvirus maliensis]|nr:nuclease [Moumouvirus maliensis]